MVERVKDSSRYSMNGAGDSDIGKSIANRNGSTNDPSICIVDKDGEKNNLDTSIVNIDVDGVSNLRIDIISNAIRVFLFFLHKAFFSRFFFSIGDCRLLFDVIHI